MVFAVIFERILASKYRARSPLSIYKKGYGIRKRVIDHMLQRSSTFDLLGNKNLVCYIQELFGHNKVKGYNGLKA